MDLKQLHQSNPNATMQRIPMAPSNRMFHQITKISIKGEQSHLKSIPSRLDKEISVIMTEDAGKALFVDGHCVYTGYLSTQACLEHQNHLMSEIDKKLTK